MDEVYVKIKDTQFEELFRFKDIVSVDEILDKLEELMLDNEHLIEVIKELKQEPEEDNEDYIEVYVLGNN